MKKWIVPLLSILLIAVLLLISSPFHIFRPLMNKKEGKEKFGILLTPGDGKKEQTDPHLILFLKRSRERLDEWLKSVNHRIESENITRFEVPFLESLRNILEWVRGKVDAKIGSSEKGKSKETHDRVFSLFKAG